MVCINILFVFINYFIKYCALHFYFDPKITYCSQNAFNYTVLKYSKQRFFDGIKNKDPVSDLIST